MIEEAEKINNMSVVVKIYENKTMNYINKIANKINEKDDVVGLFALINNDIRSTSFGLVNIFLAPNKVFNSS